MLKSTEILNQINEKMEAIKNLAGEEKKAMFEEIKNLKSDYEVELGLEKMEKENFENKIEDGTAEQLNNVEVENKVDKKKDVANALRLMIKDIANKELTTEEREIVNGYKAVKNGVTGDTYILPQDISTIIVKKIRAFNSLKEQMGYIKTSALTGAFPVDATPDVELVDFVDGTALSDSNNLAFTQVTFSMKEKGAILGLTNTLLAFTDNDLINFVADKIARRYVKTVNKIGFDLLKAGKTVKTLTDVKGLVKSLQVDIDPALLGGSVVITNQNGYQKLIEKEDLKGVSYIQPDLTKPAILTINGCPVVVFANSMLADRVDTTKQFAPVIYGNIKNAMSFVDSGIYNFASSTEAGFTTNMTLCRLVTYFDIVKTDAGTGDEVYVYGEIQTV